MTREQAREWLAEAERYFENRPTGGEDMAHWANVANADACRKIAKLLDERTTTSVDDLASVETLLLEREGQP